MAFIFDAIKNNTYNVFCQCLQYILVFLYSLEIFSDTDLLCKDLVLCGLIWQGIVFIFYIVNFVMFDIKIYGPSKQVQSNKSGDENGSDNSSVC